MQRAKHHSQPAVVRDPTRGTVASHRAAGGGTGLHKPGFAVGPNSIDAGAGGAGVHADQSAASHAASSHSVTIGN